MSFSEIAAKRAKAEQGKTAEKAVRKVLEKYSAAVASFIFERSYDARSAGGKFQRVAGDFRFYSPAGHGLLEVKEMKHDVRLPYKNYELSRVAGARKHQLAGGHVIVLVFSSTLDGWREVPFDFFRERDPAKPSGSWDLSEFGVRAQLAPVLNVLLRPHLKGYEA